MIGPEGGGANTPGKIRPSTFHRFDLAQGSDHLRPTSRRPTVRSTLAYRAPARVSLISDCGNNLAQSLSRREDGDPSDLTRRAFRETIKVLDGMQKWIWGYKAA